MEIFKTLCSRKEKKRLSGEEVIDSIPPLGVPKWILPNDWRIGELMLHTCVFNSHCMKLM